MTTGSPPVVNTAWWVTNIVFVGYFFGEVNCKMFLWVNTLCTCDITMFTQSRGSLGVLYML